MPEAGYIPALGLGIVNGEQVVAWAIGRKITAWVLSQHAEGQRHGAKDTTRFGCGVGRWRWAPHENTPNPAAPNGVARIAANYVFSFDLPYVEDISLPRSHEYLPIEVSKSWSRFWNDSGFESTTQIIT